MSTTASAQVTLRSPTVWVWSAPVDLLLVANVAWPLVALIGVAAWTAQPLTFLQLYVVSSAHRWITVPLVLLDRKHFPADSFRFGSVAAGTTALTLAGLLLAFLVPHPAARDNLLVYLLMVDYVWNAWHFASQHAGIFRIYGRKAEVATTFEEAEREKAILRIMVLWVLLRTALMFGVDRGNIPEALTWIGWLDPLAFLAPLWLWLREVQQYSAARLPRVAYLGSVISVYAAVVVMLHLPASPLRGGVLIAHALFHAFEYLVVCGWAMRGKRGGVREYIAPRVGVTVLVFSAVIGVLNYLLVHAASVFWWSLFTLWVSYLHYAWDGMIWKAPAKPAR